MTKQTQKKIAYGEITEVLLGVVAVAGILTVGVVAPNILQYFPIGERKRYSKKSVDHAFRRLQRRGLVTLVPGVNGRCVALTEKGDAALFLLQTEEKLKKKPKRWDQKWRLLIFDIEEKRRTVRDAVRHSLIQFSFHRLQDSVWVYPYPCDDMLELLRVKYRVRHDALILTADRFSKDGNLCRHFGLENG